MTRPLSPPHFQSNNVSDVGVGPATETRFDGDNAFADYEMGSPVRAFEPGIGRIEPYDPNDWQNTSTDYYHTDHLGTVRVMTASTGMPLDLNGSTSSGHDMVFTAFGELVVGVSDGGSDRYGYVGAHGYQAHDEMPFLHVGHRYYDPSIGRFLQRDPIGLIGGLNVYTYVENAPSFALDPEGLQVTMSPHALAGAGFTAKEIEIMLGCAVAAEMAKQKHDNRDRFGDFKNPKHKKKPPSRLNPPMKPKRPPLPPGFRPDGRPEGHHPVQVLLGVVLIITIVLILRGRRIAV